MLLDGAMLDIRHARQRYPRVKAPTVPSPPNKIFTNATSESLFQHFIYLVIRPVGYASGGSSSWLNWPSNGVPFRTLSSQIGRGRLSITLTILNISVMKF
jgi:hypothetical protein